VFRNHDHDLVGPDAGDPTRGPAGKEVVNDHKEAVPSLRWIPTRLASGWILKTAANRNDAVMAGAVITEVVCPSLELSVVWRLGKKQSFKKLLSYAAGRCNHRPVATHDDSAHRRRVFGDKETHSLVGGVITLIQSDQKGGHLGSDHNRSNDNPSAARRVGRTHGAPGSSHRSKKADSRRKRPQFLGAGVGLVICSGWN
jgi:hypothetical protein